MKMYANMLNRVYNKLTVQSMISSLHKSWQVNSTHKQIRVMKLDARKGNYIEVLQNCIEFELGDAIAFLKEKSKEKNRFREARKQWLEMLLFAEKNYDKLKELQKNPKANVSDYFKPEEIPMRNMA